MFGWAAIAFSIIVFLYALFMAFSLFNPAYTSEKLELYNDGETGLRFSINEPFGFLLNPYLNTSYYTISFSHNIIYEGNSILTGPR